MTPGQAQVPTVGGLPICLITGLTLRRLALHPFAPPVNQLAFEFAGTTKRAQALLSSWGAEARPRLRAVILLDFAVIPGYVALLTGLLALVYQQPSRRLLGGVVLAGALDVLENLAMLSLAIGALVWIVRGVFSLALRGSRP